jgi:transcriptional regulator with XRE-family HTH domain
MEQDKIWRLEEIREELGLSKQEFAGCLGIKANYYTHISNANGKGNLRLEHLESLLASKSVNPVWIMTGQGEKYLNLSKAPTQGTVLAGEVPIAPANGSVDQELLNHFVIEVMRQIQLPLLASDFAYAILLDFGKRYMGKNPDATQQTLDIPGLSAAFLALLQTAQSLIEHRFESGEDTIELRFAGQTYRFVHHPQTGK